MQSIKKRYLTKSGGDRLFGQISPKLPMNTFSTVVAAGTASAIAVLGLATYQ